MEISGGGGGGGESIPGTSRDSDKFSALYNAARTGDWKTFEKHMENAEAVISEIGETALHVAARSRNVNEFIRRLVREMRPETLALKNCYGCTALHEAATVGNTDAAKAILEINPNVLCMVNEAGELAVIVAATCCHKETLQYLVSVSNPDIENSPFQGQLGVDLLVGAVGCEHFGIALDLIKNYPELARLVTKDKECIMPILALMEKAFPVREDFNCWERFIYQCAPLKLHEPKAALPASDDVENANADAPKCSRLFHVISEVGKQVESKIWNVAEHIVPGVRSIRDKKKTHKQACDLVMCLCREMASLPRDEAAAMHSVLFLWAAEHGVVDVVELMMEKYPLVTGSKDDKGRTAMHLAVKNRFEKVVSLIYNKSGRRHLFTTVVDDDENSLAHMCAMIAPIHRLNIVPGAALQMQRELQWFNEMQEIVPPLRRNRVNKDGKTPQILFTEQHAKLKEDGEKSMRDMVTAYSTAATLIAGFVFASTFTSPGGVSFGTSIPIFSREPAFILFLIANPFAFFTSITSLLLFQSILTSRFAEGDFLYVLPKRLIFSLLTFFVSIIFMMVGFSVALYLVSQRIGSWVLLPVLGLAWLPVTSFVLLQCPLLFDIFYSTYGPGILSKKFDRLFT